MSFPLNLIGELLAVRVDDLKSERISLPDWKRALSGTVLAKGPECRDVNIESKVYFGAAVGMDSVLNGQEIRILKERDLDFIYG